MDAEPDLEPADWMQAEAHRMVAELLEHEQLVRQLDALMPKDDREFEEALAARELALMADGVPPAETAFRLAVVRATRQALLAQSAIRAMPTATGRSWAGRGGPSPAGIRPSQRWRARFPFVGRSLSARRDHV